MALLYHPGQDPLRLVLRHRHPRPDVPARRGGGAGRAVPVGARGSARRRLDRRPVAFVAIARRDAHRRAGRPLPRRVRRSWRSAPRLCALATTHAGTARVRLDRRPPRARAGLVRRVPVALARDHAAHARAPRHRRRSAARAAARRSRPPGTAVSWLIIERPFAGWRPRRIVLDRSAAAMATATVVLVDAARRRRSSRTRTMRTDRAPTPVVVHAVRGASAAPHARRRRRDSRMVRPRAHAAGSRSRAGPR